MTITFTSYSFQSGLIFNFLKLENGLEIKFGTHKDLLDLRFLK